MVSEFQISSYSGYFFPNSLRRFWFEMDQIWHQWTAGWIAVIADDDPFHCGPGMYSRSSAHKSLKSISLLHTNYSIFLPVHKLLNLATQSSSLCTNYSIFLPVHKLLNLPRCAQITQSSSDYSISLLNLPRCCVQITQSISI